MFVKRKLQKNCKKLQNKLQNSNFVCSCICVGPHSTHVRWRDVVDNQKADSRIGQPREQPRRNFTSNKALQRRFDTGPHRGHSCSRLFCEKFCIAICCLEFQRERAKHNTQHTQMEMQRAIQHQSNATQSLTMRQRLEFQPTCKTQHTTQWGCLIFLNMAKRKVNQEGEGVGIRE